MYLLVNDQRIRITNGRAYLLKYARWTGAQLRCLASLGGWAWWNKADLKAGEWLVVLIGLTLGAVVLGISPAPLPEAAAITPEPAPANSSLGNRMGEEWACTIVEDGLNLVNLVCEKDEGSSSFIRLESQLESVHIPGANP